MFPECLDHLLSRRSCSAGGAGARALQSGWPGPVPGRVPAGDKQREGASMGLGYPDLDDESH